MPPQFSSIFKFAYKALALFPSPVFSADLLIAVLVATFN